MRLLVYTDLHLKPAGSGYDIDAMQVPDDIDAVLVVGDLTHRAHSADIELAREFVEQFDTDTPVVYVPGNHDHAPMPSKVVEPFTASWSGHRLVRDFGDVTIVGLGCEQRSLSPAIDQCAFPALDSRDAAQSDRRYAADQVADDLEAACLEVVRGAVTPREAARSLGIDDADLPEFTRGVERVEFEYDQLADLLEDQTNVLLVTHVPPFNTSFDRHHAVGTREADREFLHVGSIATKLAIREHDVFAALSGHSHTYGYEPEDGTDGRTYCLNLGYRGIGTVTLDAENRSFGFTQASTGGA
jgi:Icc-related predicted phosphoesterase